MSNVRRTTDWLDLSHPALKVDLEKRNTGSVADAAQENIEFFLDDCKNFPSRAPSYDNMLAYFTTNWLIAVETNQAELAEALMNALAIGYWFAKWEAEEEAK